MAKVKYDVMPTRVSPEELGVGDFFIHHFNLDGIKTFSLFVVADVEDGVGIRAIRVDDNPMTGDDNNSVFIKSGTLIEPVYVDITVKGYCK